MQTHVIHVYPPSPYQLDDSRLFLLLCSVDAIGKQLDKLNSLAGDMRDEVVTQGAKISKIEDSLWDASAKQTLVTARAKQLNK